MPENRFRFDGLVELRDALRKLPADLRGEAGHIVQGEANAAAVAVRRVYVEHKVTGNLAAGVDVTTEDKGQFGVVYVVHSRAKHAWLFDNGSEARHWADETRKSTGAMWTKTPPTHVFVQTMIRGRRRMFDLLKDLLSRQGLAVSGDG